MTELVSAAANGNLILLKSLLDQGGNIEERDNSGDTPLNEAARRGHLEVVHFLIGRGADLSTQNKSGSTPLMAAARNGYKEVIQLLQEAAEKAKQPRKEWVLMAEDAVAYVRTYPKMLRKITEIFNFESRERLMISENMRTRAESIASPTGFDDLPQARIEQALAQFTQLGGVVDKDFVLRGTIHLKKKPGLD
ncbi:MAG: ankyrin repeat domain-containing protein [Alphaproteobacteria bacterium]|nr:ankyrin repeat domain-containing protein [Alphaproteobacteria bacterium]